jgi:hypothetical protein
MSGKGRRQGQVECPGRDADRDRSNVRDVRERAQTVQTSDLSPIQPRREIRKSDLSPKS